MLGTIVETSCIERRIASHRVAEPHPAGSVADCEFPDSMGSAPGTSESRSNGPGEALDRHRRARREIRSRSIGPADRVGSDPGFDVPRAGGTRASADFAARGPVYQGVRMTRRNPK